MQGIEIQYNNEFNIELGERKTKQVEIINDSRASQNNDYEKLKNLPKINDIELIGNKKSSELKLQDEMEEISNLEIDKMFKGGMII